MEHPLAKQLFIIDLKGKFGLASDMSLGKYGNLTLSIC
jgi:hypothetical protein